MVILNRTCRGGQGAFWGQVTAPIMEMIDGKATLHSEMLPGGYRVIIEMRSGVPTPQKGTPILNVQPMDKGELLMQLDVVSADGAGKDAPAMMELLNYLPELPASGHISSEQLYKLIQLTTPGGASALIQEAEQVKRIRALSSTAELSREDRDWLLKKCNLKTNRMFKQGAIRVPYTRMLLGSEPHKDLVFKEDLRIAFAGGSPDVNMIFALMIFKTLQETLRKNLSSAAFNFDVRKLFETVPAAKFWREPLGIPYY